MVLPPEFAPLCHDPRRTALLFDFDGTLAPIVADPAAARPAPGAVEALVALRPHFGVVAAISGRPVSFLAEQLPDQITVSGLYGLELRADGVQVDAEEAAAWRPVIAEIVTRARDAFPEAVVEDKGLSITLHHRRHPELADELDAWSAQMATEYGAHRRTAKASVELHPAVDLDKGTVVRALADGYDTVLYAGDDVGDIPAFAAVHDLGSDRTGLRLVVASDETDPEVLAAADVVVGSPVELVEILGELIRAVS